MNLAELEREIEHYFAANISVELESSPGVGKSDTIRYITEKFSRRDGFKWGFGVAFLATYTPVDLLGYMVPTKKQLQMLDALGQPVTHETLVSAYTMPPWMLSEEGIPLNSYQQAVLLLDEYDKGEPDVKKTSAELLLHGAIGPHKLNKTVHVVACSNRVKDRSGSTKSFDFILNRRARIKIESSFKAWENWAIGANMPPVFILFAQKHSKTVFTDEVPQEQGEWCTPRSYAAAVRWLIQRMNVLARRNGTAPHNFGINDPQERAFVSAGLAGIMGEPATIELVAWLQMRLETPPFSQIIRDPKGCPIPEKIDAKMLTCYECAHSATMENIEAVCTYVKRLPADMHVTFAKGAARKNPILMTHDAMTAFIDGNTALLLAIG